MLQATAALQATGARLAETGATRGWRPNGDDPKSERRASTVQQSNAAKSTSALAARRQLLAKFGTVWHEEAQWSTKLFPPARGQHNSSAAFARLSTPVSAMAHGKTTDEAPADAADSEQPDWAKHPMENITFASMLGT